jgi:DNA-binding transcriptional MerR regulator
MADLLIGAVAKETGVSVPTIRYYESLGLLSQTPRSTAGYRHYGNGALEELRFIKKAQALGFSLEEIKEILTLSRSGTTPCEHVLDLARHHLRTVDERIAQLSRLRNQLAGEIAKWDGIEQPTCKGLCRIIAGADEPGVDPEPVLFHTRAPRRKPPRSRS